MRYAFNSYSLPAATLAELTRAVARYGYDGVELRLSAGHAHGVETGLDGAGRRAVREHFEESGAAVYCLCTSVVLSNPDTQDENVVEAVRSIELASAIGAPTIRVFGGAFPDHVSRSAATSTLVASLRSLADIAAERGVTVCVETHDAWSDPRQLAAVLSEVDRESIGALWDVWHTGRGGGSSLEDAHSLLEPWIAHVQVHDGALRLDRLEFRAIGEGDVDHLEVLALLTRAGYSGAIGGEWIDWQPADVHLPRELATLRRLEALLG